MRTTTPSRVRASLQRSLRFLGALALLLSAGTALAQTGTMTGTVSASDEGPLIQANIFFSDLGRGEATDIEGRYSIDLPVGTHTYEVSFVGYDTQRGVVTIAAGQTVNRDFVLDPTVTEVISVEGYRVRRAPVETGATSVVEARDIQTLTVRSADAALQGRAAGVRVTSLSGQPGAGIQVRVRNSTSINAGSDPLFIVDGVQISNDNELSFASGNPLASINPQEIESIEVLKDAAATSIYGAQAANGVVLVTTKRGREGPTEFEFSSQLGAVDRIEEYDVLNAQQYLENRLEALTNFFVINRGLSREAALQAAIPNAVAIFGGASEENPDGTLRYIPESRQFADFNGDGTVGADEFRVVDTNWQDEIFRTGVTQQYSLSARGGNDKTRFFTLGRYADDEGQVLASRFRQFGLRLNLDHTASDLLQFESSVNLSNSNYRGTIGNGPFINSPYWAAQFIPGTVSLYNEFGDEESGFNLTPNPTFRFNPVAQEVLDTRNADVVRIIGNVAANFDLPANFLARSYAGVNFGDAQEENYRNPRIPAYQGQGEGGVDGSLSVLASRTLEFNLSQSLQWSNLFAGKHAVDALGVVEYRRGFEDDFNTRGIGFASDILRTLASSAEPTTANSTKSEFRFLSFVGNTEYTFDNTYQLAGTLRYDGSSRFGAGNRFGLFGSGSAFVRLSNLGFLRGSRLVNELKLRASYGVTGNSNIGNYNALQVFGSGVEYNGLPGFIPTDLGNSLLTWEELEEANIGLDYGLFGGRVYGAVDVYDRTTDELLLNRPLAGDSGFGGILANIGSIGAQGVEFAINTVNVDAGPVRWTTTFNISAQRGEVRELLDGEEELVLGGLVYRVGEAPAQYRFPAYAGVNPANGRPMYYETTYNEDTGEYEYGDLTYDVDDIALEDQPLWGNTAADYFGGVGSSLAVGPVSIDAFVQYDYGRRTLNNNAFFSDVDFNFNKGVRVLDRWQQPGDVTAVPAPIFNGGYPDGTSNFEFTSRFMEDASYVRLKQLTFSVQVPSRFLANTLRSARVYVQGENLVTWTNFTDTDPELVGNALGEYPQSRRFIGGLSIGF